MIRDPRFVNRALAWMRRIALARLERESVRFVCGAILAVNGLLLLVSFATAQGGRTALSALLGANHAALGGDFPAFYAAGTLWNTQPAGRLYDLDLQAQTFHELMPRIDPGHSLYYAHPPFLAPALGLLARLPYAGAYLAWLGLTLGLYGLSIWLVDRASGKGSLLRAEGLMVWLLALSFQPFVMETWRGGQLAALGLVWVALALALARSGQPIGAGIALAGCLYKPTLLVLILPCLLIGRRGRWLAGFALGALVLAGLSLATVGLDGCWSYLAFMSVYSHSSLGGEAFYPIAKFVDLSTFLTLAGLKGTPAGAIVALVATVPVVALLASTWWRFDDLDPPGQSLLIAATFTLSLVLNVHVAVYDVILAVPGMLLAATWLIDPGVSQRPAPSGPKSSAPRDGRDDATRADRRSETRQAGTLRLTPGYQALLVLVYLVPWFTQAWARGLGFQPLTVVLGAAGCYQLARCRSRLQVERAVETGPAAIRARSRAARSCGTSGQKAARARASTRPG